MAEEGFDKGSYSFSRTGSSPLVESALLDNMEAAKTLVGQITGQGLQGYYTPDKVIAGQDPYTLRAQQLAAQGVGAYQPYLSAGQQAMQSAVDYTQQGAAMGQFDPNRIVGEGTDGQGIRAYEQYMNPYQQEVIDRSMVDMQRAQEMARQKAQYQQSQAGAFGGSRGAIENVMSDMEYNRQFGDQVAKLRAQGYDNSLKNSMSAYDSQRNYLASTGAQMSNLGNNLTAMGGTAQNYNITDFSNLDIIGKQNEAYQQSINDAAQANQQADANLDFGLINFLNTLKTPTSTVSEVYGNQGQGGGSTLANAAGFATSATGTLNQLGGGAV